ncbi:histidine phosphatase family protein [Pantoea ananatis]
MKVILVRHAETEWNVQGIIQGQCDSAVSERCRRETAALVAALAKEDHVVECVYASPLGRAWQMAQTLAQRFACPVIAESALKEQAFGMFEEMNIASLASDYPAEAEALFSSYADYCPPGGESLAQSTHRMMRFLHCLADEQKHQTVCLVSHGQIIQGTLAMLKEGNLVNFARYAQPNASYSIFELIDGRCTALKWGIASHLLQC